MKARTPVDDPDMRRPRSAGAGHAAAAWALAFAALSFYWAAGGTAGLGTLSKGLRREALERPGGFVAVLWATAVVKVAAAALGLALVQPWGERVPRRLLLAAGWATGVLLTLYGGVGLVNAALAEFGVVESTDPETVRWYLLLWEPYWILGGLLFLTATGQFRRWSRALSSEA